MVEIKEIEPLGVMLVAGITAEFALKIFEAKCSKLEAEAKKLEAEAKMLEAKAKLIEAESKMLEAQAKMLEAKRNLPTDLDSTANAK